MRKTAKLELQWRKAAQQFDALQARGARHARDGKSLEARKMLYRIFAVMELWPQRATVKRSN